MPRVLIKIIVVLRRDGDNEDFLGDYDDVLQNDGQMLVLWMAWQT